MHRDPNSFITQDLETSAPAQVSTVESLEARNARKIGSGDNGSKLVVQGDHSGCDKPPVDTKRNVAF